MLRIYAAALAVSLFALLPADAGERTRIGYGRLITNDFLGDGADRERTGAIASSRIWGPAWRGELPGAFGALIELRLGAEVMAPGNLGNPAPGDRPYAGALSAGFHTHFQHRRVEWAIGADLVVTGPNTGLGSLQREFHDLIGEQQPSDATLDNQIGNGVHPSVVIEAGRTLEFGARSSLRPFVEARAGAETLIRAGFDFSFGSIGTGELLVREASSGQRYRTIHNTQQQGLSFVVGGDMAHVSDSVFLPEVRGFELTGSRDRLRAGVHWQGSGLSAFYGLTWLGKEYESQSDDQIVGSLRVNFRF